MKSKLFWIDRIAVVKLDLARARNASKCLTQKLDVEALDLYLQGVNGEH